MTRPGVYVTEAPLSRVVNPPVTTSSVAVFLGTALRGPSAPTLISSWSDFVANFGDFSENVTLPFALYQYFRNGGGGPAYVSRVFGKTGAVAANKIFADTATPTNRIKFIANEVGAWGNNFAFEIILDKAVMIPNPSPPPTTIEDTLRSTFTIQIGELYRGVLVTRERFVGLSMEPTNPRYFEKIINSITIGSNYVTVEDMTVTPGGKLQKGTTAPVYLTGGVDGTGVLDYDAAFAQYDPIDALLLVNVPGKSDVGSIATACQSRGDAFLVVDTDPDIAPSSLVVSLPETSYAAVYYPWIHIADPTPSAPRGSVLKVPPGGSVVGMILRTEATRGVFKAPAGLGSTLAGAVAVERRLTNDQLDQLSADKINAIRPVAASGAVVMGARGRSNDIAQYVSIRRTLNWVKKKAANASRFALFEPNGPNLWDQLIIANEVYLTELWEKGGLSGLSSYQAFYVKCDSDNNTPTTVSNGEVHVEIGVAPVFPAEFVIIRVGQFESDSSMTIEEI